LDQYLGEAELRQQRLWVKEKSYPQITQITQKRKPKEQSHKKAQEAQNEIETSSQGFIQTDPDSEISF